MPVGSPRPGPWRVSYMPPVREPMAAFSDSGVREIVLMCSPQMMKTDLIINGILASVLESPAHVMLVAPDENLAKTLANERIRPAAAMMPDIQAAMETTHVAGRQRGQGWSGKQWAGGGLTTTWSGAKSGLISRPVQRLFLDEVDRYSKSDIYESAQQRMTRYSGKSKLVSCSSPEDKETSLIYRRWSMGSKGWFHGRCQHCGELEKLDWGQVNRPKEKGSGYVIPDAAYYSCSLCGTRWTDEERAAAIDAGEYLHEEDWNTEFRTFRVNRLADKHLPLRDMVEHYRKAQIASVEYADYEPWRRFMKDELAEPWDPRERIASARDLAARVLQPRKVGGKVVLHKDALIVAVSVDVQDDRLEADIGAWGWHAGKKTARYWGLGYHVFPGDPTDQRLWAKIDDLVRLPWLRDGGRGRLSSAAICLVDSQGHHSEDVSRYISERSDAPFFALIGRRRLNNKRGLHVPKQLAEGWGGKPLIQVGTNVIKDWIAAHLLADKDGEPGERVFEWYEGFNYKRAYFDMLVSEERKAEWSGGMRQMVWKPRHKHIRNEALDLMVYSHTALQLHCYYAIYEAGGIRETSDWAGYLEALHNKQSGGTDGGGGATVVPLHPTRGSI